MTEETNNLSAQDVADRQRSGDRRPSNCSPREPLRRAYSRDELVAAMNQWMVVKFGSPMDYLKEPDQRKKWYRDNGFIHHFICEHFSAENAEVGLPDTAAQASASKSNNPAVSG